MIRIVIAATVLFGLLMVIYMALDWYMRWDTRKRLEAEHSEGRSALNREDYIDRGLAQYERSTEKRLLIGVVLLPLIVIGLLAFFIN